jgi:starch synthase (maltosyl-transferring)
LAGGNRPAKAVVNEAFPVRATSVREGHDSMGIEVVVTGPDGTDIGRVRMHELPTERDRYEGWVRLDREGLWRFRIEAWDHPIGTWLHRATIKIPSGVEADLECAEGALLLERLLAELTGPQHSAVSAAIVTLRSDAPPAERFAAAMTPTVHAILDANPVRDLVTRSLSYPVRVSRARALFGSWYELFPRSEGATLDPVKSGTFATATERLPAVADMGFDIVYLPPIHPIGRNYRKGHDGAEYVGPDDPGSPWAIGAAEGGHDAVHPDLGTLEDFRAFATSARNLGLEVALDFALQASPDHPWVTEHPEWFRLRSDGTIAYAENPPKLYKDIYPIYFDNDPEGIVAETLRVLRFWIAQGVTVFRVDNPHTKPAWFWERVLGIIHSERPEIIFLAEAFTRIAQLRLLGEVGFDQSYTYFTWKNSTHDLRTFGTEIAGDLAPSVRPNLFVNTPDILTEYLQTGGPAAFAIRATLGATMSPTWGVYAGFELYEGQAQKPGSEEYLHTEKFAYRPRDWAAAAESGETLAPYITTLNRVRREHPALQTLRTLHFHGSDNENVIVYSKVEGDDRVVVVCTVDPHESQSTWIHLDLAALGLPRTAQLEATDLVSGRVWQWEHDVWVHLDPRFDVAHVVSIRERPAEQ